LLCVILNIAVISQYRSICSANKNVHGALASLTTHQQQG